MSDNPPASSDFTKLLHERMRQARERAGHTQRDMATILRITQAAYEKYETRSRLPHHLLEPFALATGISLNTLLGAPDRPRQPRKIDYPPNGIV